MTLTQVNHEIGVTKPDVDCIAVALMSAHAQQQVQVLLQKITQRLGDTVWPMPADTLHITLCEVIQPKPYVEEKELLLKNLPRYQSVLEEILAVPAISVTFTAIEASPQAIIIKGQDDGTFNRLRKQLVSKLPLPNETKAPPEIIHSTIARFRNEVDLDMVKSVIADLKVNFVEAVCEFQLLLKTAPHLVTYTLVQRYPLC